MRVFIDTEFTDFANPRLISIGLCAENGAEFYCELKEGWSPEHCTEFVRDAVLPLLGEGASLSRDEAGIRIIEWLRSLGTEVWLVADIDTDWRLVRTLLWPHESEGFEIHGERLFWPGLAMAQRHESLVEELLVSHPQRHHALVDARALRTAVLKTETEFRNP